MKIAIPSRGRADTIRKHTLSLMPDALVVVDEAELETYAAVVPREQLLTHPGLQPLSRILNWILDNVRDDFVVIADDDVSSLAAMPGWTFRWHSNPAAARQVLENAAQCALDAGAGLFGFGQNLHPLFYSHTEPIRLNRWVGSVIGFVDGHGLRYDEHFTLMEDVDLCLQSLLVHRIIWCEARWHFHNDRLRNTGGSAHLRSDAAFAAERELLRRKWGRYVSFHTRSVNHRRSTKGLRGGDDATLPATTLMTTVRVPRRQP